MGRKKKDKEEYWDNAETLDEDWLNKEENKAESTEAVAEAEEVVFSGKKKKSTKASTAAPAKEEPAPVPAEEEVSFSGKKKKGKATATTTTAPATTTAPTPTATEEEVVFSGKKKKGGAAAKSTATTTTATTTNAATTPTTSTDSAETEDAKEDNEGTAAGKKKKKKGAADKEKKPAGNKKLVEFILKQREEEERKKKEEEERARIEAEEERKREEEERIREEELQREKEIKKQKAKEVKATKQKELEQQKLEQIRSRLLTNQTVTALAPNQPVAAPKEKPAKKPFIKNKKHEEVTPEPTPEVAPTPVPEPTPQAVEEKKEEEVLDDWEQHLEEPAPTPTPAPAPAPVVKESKPQPTKAVEAASKPASKEAKASKGKQENTEATSEDSLRSPIVCIMGHVDTGKTKLLDKIRHTNVQEGEAGGITQQIGATFFPLDAIKEQTKKLSEQHNLSYKVPGLLIIDTPGHESFNNLRSRGSSLCDIAILVVDLMHGLEPQTIESINLLRMRKTPFIVALNKVDRIYGFKTEKDEPIQDALKKQPKQVIQEFEDRVKDTIGQFAAQGLNAQLYYKQKTMKDFKTIVSLVPTSAIEGTGVPDLLMLLIQLTQKLMADKLLYLEKFQCTILEVKVVEGLGTTIDVILVNGTLHEGDTIVVCGLNGPIVTNIRALLTPQPLKEMRVKGTYIHHKEIHAAMGIKIVAPELDKAVAGSSLLLVGPNDDLEAMKEDVMQDLENMKKKVDTSGKGVWVQASTLGSLEALLEFLKESKIPVSGVNIGPVNKKDVIRASIMLDRQPEYAVILAFDVKVVKEAKDIADEMGVRIFTADIIYHLFDQFTAYMQQLKSEKKAEAAAEAVFPVRLKILPEFIFNKKDPIVLGVDIVDGSLRVGTPIVVPAKEFIELGKVTSIEHNRKAVEKGKKGTQVAVKIEVPTGEQQKAYGRHFDHNDELVSKISRQSIDLLKENFRDDLDKEDVQLLKKLKDLFVKHGKFGGPQ